MANCRQPLEGAKFIPITYRIALREGPMVVDGFAFETPGWPEWHACVRYGNRWGDQIIEDWIIDHYETGMALSGSGTLRRKEEAPAAMLALLEKKGREHVHNVLRGYQCLIAANP